MPEKSDDTRLEAHRAISRELHLSAQRAYTFGGLSALAGFGAPIALGVYMGQAHSPLPYVTAVMLGLVSLYFAKRLIDAHIHKLWSRLILYCESNSIEFDALIEYFASRDYTMLRALLPRTRQ